MQPVLDEVQQALNKAVQNIISVSKGVAQWSKERKRYYKPLYPERSGSFSGDHTLSAGERRASVTSNAPSEGSFREARKGRGEGEAPAVQMTIQQQPKNYYKSVSDNKEIAKLASLLSTSINSTKKVTLSEVHCTYTLFHEMFSTFLSNIGLLECRNKRKSVLEITKM